MEERGIKFEKIEQVQRVEKVCNEGEGCEAGSVEYEEVTLPKECIEMGVSDVTDCKMIAGRVNEERIKNGEKIVVDEKGKVDYISSEQIKQIADDSEKASQEVNPNFEKAEGIKQEINNLEQNMNQIEEKTNQETKEMNGDNVQGNIEGNNVVEQQNGVNNEVSSGDPSGGDSEMTGAVIGSENKKSFLGKILKNIFGV